ncbi:hypothetical protein BofuT4_P136560.1 [Botrytis cinerea T4]|uniref:Uncharacterized protein n=1 Tax=Botryotinia fuckeliana (strain T4) TaxID=999810 RepID=G2YPR3_BOTF4|nr:hypothetical protein BofuT4_P136560.1 [Botrytis cinerea T4]
MVLFLLPGLRPHWNIGQANIEKQELFTPKKPVGNSGRKFPLPPHILHRLINLHNSCTSFPSKPSSTPSLLPSLIEDSSTSTPKSLHPAGSGAWPGKRPAEGTADERPGKKAKYGLASRIDLEDRETDADDEDSDFDPADTPSDRDEVITTADPPTTVPTPIAEPAVDIRLASPSDPESDFSDAPSSKRRALTPPASIPELIAKSDVKPIAATGRWDFTLTAKQAGYIYNPRKSMTDLSDRFATPSDPDNTHDTDDSESDFNSTPNHTPSPSRIRISSPLPLPLSQWKYYHNRVDRNNPTTPPSIGTKRKMEHTYAEWHQGEMDASRAPSYSPITLPADTPQSVDLDEAEAGTAQYNSESQQQNTESSRVPSYSRHINSSSSPQIQQSPKSASATTVFPTDIPSPSVPCRLEPHSPVLDHLTAQYIAQGPHPQVPHVNHAAVDQRNASHILRKHQDDRAPFVRAASRRLQAVVGVRNDLPFDLLMGTGVHDASNLVVRRDGALVDLGLKNLGRREEDVSGGGDEGGFEIGEDLTAARNNGGTSGESFGNNRESMAMGMDANTNANEAHNANTTAQYPQDLHTSFDTFRSPSNTSSYFSSSSSSHHQQTPQKAAPNPPFSDPPATPPFFPPSVNPHTGEGLREYLLQRASMTGSSKKECRSISFHDFTPDLRTGEFRNELLVHFGVDGLVSSEKIEVVELGLPDINGNLHPWLSIFIQRPLLTTTSPSSTLPSTSTSTSTSTPPNFPKPTPTVWLCIAVPLANITTYPIQPDTSIPPSLLEPTFLSHSQHNLPTKKIAKRQDYDFSFQGIPIFEFSTRTLFPPEIPLPNTAPTADFLSIEVPHPYDPNDAYLAFPAQVSQNPELLQRETRKFARAVGVKGEELRTYGDLMVDESGVDVSEELSPNEGIWWCEFYRGITRDRIRWERVKRCMGRRRCRVVLRWQDVPDEMKRLGSCSTSSSGIGLGSNRKSSEAERVMQEMSRENMGGMGKKRRARKSMQSSHANTSSSVGLGVMNAHMGSHSHSNANSHAHMRLGSGEALRGSLRARAIGNRMSFNEGI